MMKLLYQLPPENDSVIKLIGALIQEGLTLIFVKPYFIGREIR
jgi:hypothetical protein